MIIHPGSKTLSRYIDQELPASQAKKLAHHLEKCQRCRARLRMLQAMEPALTAKQQLPCDFRHNFVSALKVVKRIEQPSCAEIKTVLGQAMVYRNGIDGGVGGFPGMALKKGDRLSLLGNSLALIELHDGSYIYLNKETEINLTSRQYNFSLQTGEIFAMMKPQRKPFEIWTPAAVLGVMGTDFDTTVQDKKTTLKVLKGKVSFQNEAGKTVVKKSQQVEATKHIRPTTTRLKETRSIMSWTKPVRPERVRGGAALRNLGYLMVLLALIIAGIWYLRQSQEPAAPEVVTLEKTEPLELAPPHQEEGLSWRVRINDQTNRDNIWVDIYIMVTRCDVIEVDEQSGSRVLVTIEDAKYPEWAPETEAAGKMIGRQFEYQVSPEGKFQSSRVADGKALEWDEISPFVMAVWGTDFGGVYLKNPIVPGDRWTDQFEDKIPGYPNSYVRGVASYQFVGYELRDGVEYGVVRAQILASLGGGLPIEKTVEPRVARYGRLDNININVRGEYIVDVESGRVVSTTNITTRGGIKGTVTSIIKGRRVPVTEKIEQETGVVTRSFATVEYLP